MTALFDFIHGAKMIRLWYVSALHVQRRAGCDLQWIGHWSPKMPFAWQAIAQWVSNWEAAIWSSTLPTLTEDGSISLFSIFSEATMKESKDAVLAAVAGKRPYGLVQARFSAVVSKQSSLVRVSKSVMPGLERSTVLQLHLQGLWQCDECQTLHWHHWAAIITIRSKYSICLCPSETISWCFNCSACWLLTTDKLCICIYIYTHTHILVICIFFRMWSSVCGPRTCRCRKHLICPCKWIPRNVWLPKAKPLHRFFLPIGARGKVLQSKQTTLT